MMKQHFQSFMQIMIVATISVAIAGSQTLAQERAPSVLASQVLPAKYLQGTGYSIGERLEIRSNRYLFRVRADYGEFTALGLPMLELRLREHLAIENARRLSRDSQILRGAIEVARQTPAGARTLLTDPIGSLRRLPLGIQANVNTIVDPLERRAGTKARRELASSIGADPETRNPVLNFYLDQLAIRKNIGRSATQTGLGFAVPGLGLLATNETIREQVRASGPRQIANDVHRRLSALGIHHQISTPFANNLQLTSTEKLLFVTHLETLRGVDGLEALVTSATNAKSEASLLSQLQELGLLVNLHRQYTVLAILPLKVPVTRLQDGRFIGVAAVDIVHDAQTLSGDINDFRAAYPSQEVHLLVTGTVTPAARSIFQTAEINVLALAQTIGSQQR